jgi:hypothetical protein
MKKSTLGVLVLTICAVPVFAEGKAQDQAAAARAAAGCGPDQVQFSVKTDGKNHPVAQPEAGKAVVYFFEKDKQEPDFTHVGEVTTRVGLDGAWVGANRGMSYFFFTVDPGEHHVCANWQSSLKRYSKLGAAATFTAEAGKAYYFRARVQERKERQPEVRLEAIDNSEGQFLIAASAYSTSHPKK